MDQKQRPLACTACDGLGVRIVRQGAYLAICERCRGTGEEGAASIIHMEGHKKQDNRTEYETGDSLSFAAFGKRVLM